MGYYIECAEPKGKAAELLDKLDAIEITPAEAEHFIKEDADAAVLCIVDNGLFEAAAYCHNLSEFRNFSRPEDDRPKTWLLAPDRRRVAMLAGYNK